MVCLAAIIVAGVSTLVMNFVTGEEPLQVRSVAVGKDPRVLEVTYLGPPPQCDASTRVSVEESDDTVELRAWATRTDDGDCPAIGRLLTTRVELDDDLGMRAVIDGRNGQSVDVSGGEG